MSTPDPLAVAVADFRAKWAEFCSIPDEECSQATAHPWREAWAKLEAAPTPRSRAGALAAISFVLEDTKPDGPSAIEPAHRSLLEAVKRYLET